MITHLGRVVYERIEHKFKEKDVARILASELDRKTPEQIAAYLVRVLEPTWKTWGFKRNLQARFIVTFLYDMGIYFVFELRYVAELLGYAEPSREAADQRVF